VAEQQLGSRATPERIDALAQITIAYNSLDPEGHIGAGRTSTVELRAEFDVGLDQQVLPDADGAVYGEL
jgi:hypothetical protein